MATTLWKFDNPFGNNESGFNALPAGIRDVIDFNYLGIFTVFWSSSKSNRSKRSFVAGGIETSSSLPQNTYYGFSVRCVKD